jgi:glycosyltransferase involved in cell wall biosynthesis
VAETPKISVLIPCYNLGEFLDEAVDSVLRQTYQDFEIVVVDDGSTDAETRALLADYQRPKTRVIRAAHGGVSAARNLAIARTTGPYLCALDADDRLEPSYFEKAVAVLEAEPATTFVSCWLRTFGTESWEWKPERCDLPTLLWEDTILTASLVRRDAVVAVGGYDTQMPIQGLEDWDLWLTLAEHGCRGVILREVLFNYRRRPGSLSTVSWNGSGHLPLMQYRLAKHERLYRQHLLEVLLHQDSETAVMLRRNDEIERYIATELEPTVAARQAELAALNTRLTALASTSTVSQERTRDLEKALSEATAEVAALRSSISWRLTAPLRRAYDYWLRARSTS